MGKIKPGKFLRPKDRVVNSRSKINPKFKMLHTAVLLVATQIWIDFYPLTRQRIVTFKLDSSLVETLTTNKQSEASEN